MDKQIVNHGYTTDAPSSSCTDRIERVSGAVHHTGASDCRSIKDLVV